MTQKAKTQKKKRSLRKRIFRYFLWTIFIVTIFIVLLITGLVLYLTPSRIESIAEKIVSENLGRQLSFTNAHFNVFNGFIFQDIVLSPPDSQNNPVTIPVHSATAKEISLRYSLAGILKRRFLITSALIDSPNVKIVITPLETDSLQKKERAPSDSVFTVDSFEEDD